MNIRIKLVMKFQKTHWDFVFKEIVDEFNPLINFHLKTIPYQYKKDVRQEILIGLFDVIQNRFVIKKNIEIDKTAFTLDNLNLLIIKDFSIVNKVFKSKYVNKFINKYGIKLIKNAFISEEERKLFLYEYMLFCNERQFTYYLNKTFDNIKKDFFSKYSLDKEYVVKSLNEQVADEIELVNLIEYEDINASSSVFEKYGMSDDDLDFVLSFIDKGRKLSQKEVSIKYNVSQQFVSKKLNSIINKYKN